MIDIRAPCRPSAFPSTKDRYWQSMTFKAANLRGRVWSSAAASARRCPPRGCRWRPCAPSRARGRAGAAGCPPAPQTRLNASQCEIWLFFVSTHRAREGTSAHAAHRGVDDERDVGAGFAVGGLARREPDLLGHAAARPVLEVAHHAPFALLHDLAVAAAAAPVGRCAAVSSRTLANQQSSCKES